MTCGRCPEGRRFADGGVWCVMYGMILRENHECRLEGGKRHEQDAGGGADGGGEAEVYEDRGGAAGAVPGVVPGS